MIFSSNFELSTVTPSGIGGNWPNDGLIQTAAEANSHRDGEDNILYLSSPAAMRNTKPAKCLHERSSKHHLRDRGMVRDAYSSIIFNAIVPAPTQPDLPSSALGIHHSLPVALPDVTASARLCKQQ